MRGEVSIRTTEKNLFVTLNILAPSEEFILIFLHYFKNLQQLIKRDAILRIVLGRNTKSVSILQKNNVKKLLCSKVTLLFNKELFFRKTHQLYDVFFLAFKKDFYTLLYIQLLFKSLAVIAKSLIISTREDLFNRTLDVLDSSYILHEKEVKYKLIRTCSRSRQKKNINFYNFECGRFIGNIAITLGIVHLIIRLRSYDNQ